MAHLVAVAGGHRAARVHGHGVVPAGLLASVDAGDMIVVTALALVVQYVGVIAERWFFFAQANHPQNVYYQAAS